jgi:hypothetical protein
MSTRSCADSTTRTAITPDTLIAMKRGEDPFEQRAVSSTDVLDRRVDLRDYPHRYLFVHADTSFSHTRQAMPRLLAAVEALEGQSWELVNIMALSNFYAVMRRPRRPNN